MRGSGLGSGRNFVVNFEIMAEKCSRAAKCHDLSYCLSSLIKGGYMGVYAGELYSGYEEGY